MRWLVALRNVLDGLFPRTIDTKVYRSPLSPTEAYLARQRESANAWQEVDR